MWHVNAKRSDDGYGLLCIHKCYPQFVTIWMTELIEKECARSITILTEYLTQGEYGSVPKPNPVEDSKERKAKRLLYIADYASQIVGYDIYFKAIKYAAMGTGAMTVLLQGDTAKVLYPLMECLKQFGVEGPTGLMRVYYLGCHYQLQRQLDLCLESVGHAQGDRGVLQQSCPLSLLDYVGRYSGPAQWLYSASLPSPHDTDDWRSWYLSRLVLCQGWTLLYHQVESSTLYNGTSCPAFALVTRQDSDGKEALLVVRGTQSSVDWTINLSETMYSFVYRSGPRGEVPVSGGVHTGMMLGALAILDVYGMRACLHSLIERGFDIKIVGHSLGAGTAALLTAELKNGLYTAAISRNGGDSPLSSPLPRVTAVGFGSPPVMDETIADAFLSDDMMVTVVHRDDIVPRLCRFNLENLAKEVVNVTQVSDKWMAEDQICFKRYGSTYGMMGDMSSGSVVEGGVEQPSAASLGSSAEMKSGGDSAQIVEEDPYLEVDNPADAVPIILESNAHIVDQPSAVPFVIPGKIIHLFISNARYNATLCDHRLVAFRSIAPLSHGVEDHKMCNHIKALRAIRHVAATTIPTPLPTWQAAYSSADKKWSRCYVCDSDVTWPFITKSDSTRALVMHHCKACGKVVCCICAPKADLVPAEGVGQYNTLEDFSIALPSLGFVEPERVCVPCYLHSYLF